MKVLVAQSCPSLSDPVDCSPQGSSVHRILQARILVWGAIPFSRKIPWRWFPVGNRVFAGVIKT